MPVRVLVIDDSALMRKRLREILEEADYEVITARNGQEGLEKAKRYDPAVVTLDINMPVMDGVTCLGLMMEQSPRPVIMVSSLTEKGALVTFEALELGAVDYVSKPGGTVSLNINDVAAELLCKVSAAANSHTRKSKGLRQRLRIQREQRAVPREKKERLKRVTKPKGGFDVVVVGASTGGPGTVEEIISQLPADFSVPVIIAQHMPARFTQVFAERLDHDVAIKVIEVDKPMHLKPETVYIGRGNADVKLIKRGANIMVSSVPQSEKDLWHPSVRVMVKSVNELIEPEKVICVELTGMGDDGAREMASLRKLGAKVIAESEETAVVFGMPRALIEQDNEVCILPSFEIAETLIRWTK